MVLPVGQGIRLGARVAEDEIPREHPAHVLVLADGHLLQAIDIRFAALHHPLANIFTHRPAVSALLILRQGHPDIARHHAVYAAPLAAAMPHSNSAAHTIRIRFIPILP